MDSEPTIEELTRAWVQHWQAHGLMPEPEPGKLLVWVEAFRIEMPKIEDEKIVGRELYYSARRGETKYRIGQPFAEENTVVFAGPLCMFPSRDEVGYCGSAVALLVDREAVRMCPTRFQTGVLFCADRGVAVAGYRGERVRDSEIQLHRQDGVDVMAWLSDPTAMMGWDWAEAPEVALPNLPAPPERDPCRPPRRGPRFFLRRDLLGWQAIGRLPEGRPGQVLVWLGVERLGPSKGRTSEYREDGRRYWLHQPYSYAKCEVSTTPADALSRCFESQDDRCLLLAILAEDTWLETGGNRWERDELFAMRGTPVACYEVVRAEGDGYAYRWIEGEDAFRWCP